MAFLTTTSSVAQSLMRCGYARGCLPCPADRRSIPSKKEAAYDRLADLVRANLDMAAIRRVMGLPL